MPKALKRTLAVLLSLIVLLALVVGCYVAYMSLQYSRIEDSFELGIHTPQTGALAKGQPYTALTYNIGFGAYSHEFSFFMDSGVMDDGTPVTGRYARAHSLETVQRNTDGALDILAAQNPDFCLLQEVDVKAHRSWQLNQAETLQSALPGYGAVYASNFHSAFLAYPLHQPHGAVEAGLLTFSKYEITGAVRRSYPVDESFPTKFFDLDRCFSLLRIPVQGGGQLVLINTHMSAYDEGGRVRAAQMEMLAETLQAEYEAGNWVIVGGDFNHALGGTIDTFPARQQVPAWVYEFDETALPGGFSVVGAGNCRQVATCRSTDIPYEAGVNYTAVLDGFIVSANVHAAAENIDAGFAYSDHNPVQLTFTLE